MRQARTHPYCTAACPTPAGYTLAAGMDMFGNDIKTCNPLGTNSTDDLARLCRTTSGCVAFDVWREPGGVESYCLKHTLTALSNESTTYMKGACQGIYTGAQRTS
jgi:hypothetical protein